MHAINEIWENLLLASASETAAYFLQWQEQAKICRM